MESCRRLFLSNDVKIDCARLTARWEETFRPSCEPMEKSLIQLALGDAFCHDSNPATIACLISMLRLDAAYPVSLSQPPLVKVL